MLEFYFLVELLYNVEGMMLYYRLINKSNNSFYIEAERMNMNDASSPK